MFSDRETRLVGRLDDYLRKSSAHNKEHYLIAAGYAIMLLGEYGGNRVIVMPAILTHDFGREEKISGPVHAVRSAEIARPLLGELGYSSKEIDEIAKLIVAHDAITPENVDQYDLNAKIVHDADRLAGMGAIGVIRVAEHCAEHGYDMEQVMKRLAVSMPERIRAMTLPLAREIAEERYRTVVEPFVRELKKELEGKGISKLKKA